MPLDWYYGTVEELDAVNIEMLDCDSPTYCRSSF